MVVFPSNDADWNRKQTLGFIVDYEDLKDVRALIMNDFFHWISLMIDSDFKQNLMCFDDGWFYFPEIRISSVIDSHNFGQGWFQLIEKQNRGMKEIGW